MGKNNSRSILGDYSGAVGTVVLYSYRGIPVVKSRPIPSRKPATSKQLDQRNIFRLVTKLIEPLKDDFKRGYQLPRKSALSPQNAAVSHHMRHNVGGDPGHLIFDLTTLRITKPRRKTQSSWNAGLWSEEGNKVTITWELNPFPQKCAQLNDEVYIVFYNKTANRFTSIKRACERSHLNYSYTFDPVFKGHEVYTYMYLVSADGKLVSETEYLGMIRLE